MSPAERRGGSTVVEFRAPGRRRLHEDVAEQLRDAILDGRLHAGEKLPPERELAERFEVNRTSVREAIKVLEGLGLVTVRQGDGATVQPLTEAALDVLGPMIFHGGRLDAALLGDLAEVLLPLLHEMCRLGIERRRPEHVRTLRALRDVVAAEYRDVEERFAALRDILVLASDMTGNRVWQMLARRTRALFASAPFIETRKRLQREPGRLVPIIDRCIAGLDADKEVDARDALQELISVIGAETAAPGAPPRRRRR